MSKKPTQAEMMELAEKMLQQREAQRLRAKKQRDTRREKNLSSVTFYVPKHLADAFRKEGEAVLERIIKSASAPAAEPAQRPAPLSAGVQQVGR